MKRTITSLLGIAVLTLGANGVFAATASNDWFEQWHRTKYGRSSAAETRQNAERANTAFREEPAAQPAKSWFENWYETKYGRPSPREEARLKAAGANTAFREELTATQPVNTWLKDWYKAKYGGSYPLVGGRK